jgi:hypothetical protein
MSRNAICNVSRRPQIAEDAARLMALQRGILECQIAIDQSRATIQATVAAIGFLDRLQDHPGDAATELQQLAPTSLANRRISPE